MEVSQSNFLIHQSAWNDFCSEIETPAKNKKKRSQRKLSLLALVDKYYKQANDLPELKHNSLIDLDSSTRNRENNNY